MLKRRITIIMTAILLCSMTACSQGQTETDIAVKTEVSASEKLSDNAYCMTLKTVKSGERQMYYYTMIGDLLYEEMKYENTKYLPPEIIVYRKQTMTVFCDANFEKTYELGGYFYKIENLLEKNHANFVTSTKKRIIIQLSTKRFYKTTRKSLKFRETDICVGLFLSSQAYSDGKI